MKTLKAQLEAKNAGVRRDNSQLEEGRRNLGTIRSDSSC